MPTEAFPQWEIHRGYSHGGNNLEGIPTVRWELPCMWCFPLRYSHGGKYLGGIPMVGITWRELPRWELPCGVSHWGIPTVGNTRGEIFSQWYSPPWEFPLTCFPLSIFQMWYVCVPHAYCNHVPVYIIACALDGWPVKNHNLTVCIHACKHFHAFHSECAPWLIRMLAWKRWCLSSSYYNAMLRPWNAFSSER